MPAQRIEQERGRTYPPSLDQASVRILSDSRVEVIDVSWTNAHGPFQHVWNASASQAPPGVYTVEFNASYGRSYAPATMSVLLAPSYNGAVNLTKYRTYAHLNATADADTYRIKHPSGCGDEFQVTVTGRDERVVQYSLTKGEPSPTLTYNMTKDSTEGHTQTGVAAGEVWALKVHHAPAGGLPEVYYDVTFQGCQGQPPPEEPTITSNLIAPDDNLMV